MGYLYTAEMSKAFITHLIKRGPISLNAAANRYWRRMPRGYEIDDDGHKSAALWALEVSALSYVAAGIIEPTHRRMYPLDYLQMFTDITEEQLDMFVRYASVEEFNRLIIDVHKWDVDGAEIWFDPIVWKLTEKAEGLQTLPYYEGVDT